MARAKVNKLYRTFTKGLITEAGFLTYPEDASTDELNTILKRKGSRSRRMGMQYEPESEPYDMDTFDASSLIHSYHWHAVGNDATVNFLCVQIENEIHFFDTSSTPIMDGHKTFTIDLLDYKTADATDDEVKNSYAEMIGGKGFLFIAQEFIDPVVVEYDADEDDIIVNKIIIQMRDFDGLDDGLLNDIEPTELSKEHYYNLRNQGWVGPGLGPVGPEGEEEVPDPPPSTGGPGGSGGGGWGWDGHGNTQEP